MKCSEINIRDPYVVIKDGKYYMYGTRAENFGRGTAGFDVYVSEDMVNWSEPHECFNSEAYGLNTEVNWAPEVHEYNGAYFMFATFTRKTNGLRGTFILKSDNLMGPFIPHSNGEVTPKDWECLDGTLYVDPDGVPYIVFCHEHTQIIDGTICYTRLSDDLTEAVGDTTVMFKGSSPDWADPFDEERHFVTDGPFMYRTKDGVLLMLWSTGVNGKYAQCITRFGNGNLGLEFKHLPLLVDDDGGHGMLFEADGRLYLTLHTPNATGKERPVFIEIMDKGNRVEIK